MEAPSPSQDTHPKTIAVLGKYSLHDTCSVHWTVCDPSIIQRVVLLILAKVFLIGKEPDYLWFSKIFHFAQKFLPLCQPILAGLFYEQLTSATLVWVVMKVFIECMLHGRGWDTWKNPNPDACVFQDFLLPIFEEFCCRNAIRLSATLLSSSHSLVVSITIRLSFMLLSSSHSLVVSITIRSSAMLLSSSHSLVVSITIRLSAMLLSSSHSLVVSITIRLSAMLLSSSHSLVVSITIRSSAMLLSSSHSLVVSIVCYVAFF